jgi:hypothetical protein
MYYLPVWKNICTAQLPGKWVLKSRWQAWFNWELSSKLWTHSGRNQLLDQWFSIGLYNVLIQEALELLMCESEPQKL